MAVKTLVALAAAVMAAGCAATSSAPRAAGTSAGTSTGPAGSVSDQSARGTPSGPFPVKSSSCSRSSSGQSPSLAAIQCSLAGYLAQIAAGGQHPHLAAVLADQPSHGDAAQQQQPLFGHAMTRILTGLLPPAHTAPRPRH